MSKRIYSARVKKWAIASGIVGVPLAVLMIWFMVSLGSIVITGYSGDSVCAGTEKDPCIAYINFTVKEDIFIYPGNWSETAFYTDIQPKSVKMYRSWGKGWREIKLNQSCKGTWCGLSNSKDTRKFAFAFREGRDYQIKFEVLKTNSEKSMKWGFDSVDPIFYGSEDNILEYSNNDLEVNIKNALDEDIAKIKLISHEDVDKPLKVMPGKNRRVIIYEIESKVDFDNAIGNLEIINMKNNQTENKEFHYEYAIYDYVERPVYKDFCENITKNIPYSINRTELNYTYKSCETKIIDFVSSYEIVSWVDLNSNNLSKGNITIALVTDVKAGDHYDGIFTLFGKKIDKHAWWVGITPTIYWKFNDNALDEVGGNDLTKGSDGSYIDAKLGKGLFCDGGNDCASMSGTSDFAFGLNDMTLAFWINSSSSGTEMVFVNLNFWWSNGGWAVWMEANGKIRTQFGLSEGAYVESSVNVRDSEFHRVVITREGTGTNEARVYIDGVNDKNWTSPRTADLTPTTFRVATRGDLPFLGTLDDVQFFNGFAWSAEDVAFDWNDGLGREADEAPTECSPTLNEDFVITDEQICDGVEVTAGTGYINITGGNLTLINDANFTAKGLRIQTAGERVFINDGRLIFK